MSSTAARVRKLIRAIAANVIFSTAEFLHCGSRNAVDIALCRLVKSGMIERLASGIFVVVPDKGSLPAAEAIAGAKALRFNKTILGTVPGQLAAFFTDGCRTSFASVHGRLQFKQIAPSKLKSTYCRPEKRKKQVHFNQACEEPVFAKESNEFPFLAQLLALFFRFSEISKNLRGSSLKIRRLWLSSIIEAERRSAG